MIPPRFAQYVPIAVAVLGAVAWLAWLVWALRRQRLGGRPTLAVIAVLATVPALYVGLTWARLLPERWIRLERPLLALPCALIVLFVAHRLLGLSARQGALRRWLSELLVAGAALIAALATLGLELGKPLDRLAVIIAVDKSRSIDLVPDAEGRIRAELQVAELGMRDDDRIGTIAFAAEAAIEDPLRPRTRLPAPQKAEIGRDGTDIGEGIRRALAEVPADAAARIVLLTDGVNTRGDALEAAAAAVAAGVPIDVVPLDQAKVPDVRLVAVRMPPRASEGEMLEMRVVTASGAPAEIEVRIHRDGELVRKGTARIGAGEDVLRLREQAPGPGLHRYDVEITATDPRLDQAPEDNAGSSFVRVRGQAAALVMEGVPERAKSLARALENAAFRVDTVGAGGVPADIAGFAAYDVVILSDISATDLAPTQIDALASYTRDLGGGLLLMGGDRSMGPGGYGKTAIEEVSPVSFDLKQERRRASLAEIIAIDYSGSMAMSVGKQTKLELANEAAVRSAELLGSGDRLGVMHVDTSVQWTVPLGPITDKAAIAKQIRAVGPGGGGIFIDLTLQHAYEALAREKVNIKHLLLFSDGGDAEERQNAFALVSTAKSRGITTSVVALGRGSDVPALERMSQLGGGRFYLIEDAARLPAVFAQETILAARSSINETTFRPVVSTPGPATRGVSFEGSPPLTGYVVTIPKGRAQVHLRGPEGDPILATWSVGIGRAAAFTSDFKDRWGTEWTKWPDAARLFAQLARDITRLADDPRVRLEADATGGQLHVRAIVVDDDGRTESFRRLKVRVGGPDGFRREVALEATGAGAYSATVPLTRPGAYVATAIDELADKPVATTGAVLTAGEELRPTGSDRALLARLTELTGGKLRENMAGIFRDREARRFAYESLTSNLLLAAALAMLLGVAARRLALPERLTAIPMRWRQRARARAERRAVELEQVSRQTAAQTLDALRERKARVAAQAPSPAHAPVVADAAPPSMPHFGHAARPSSAVRAAPPGAAPIAPPHPSQRQLSAAEILLARRRGRPQ
jgi:Ca-activated chloride channel homolog